MKYVLSIMMVAASMLTSIASAKDIEEGNMDVEWKSGKSCSSEDPIQVHHYNERFVILRQSICLNYEAPFMFLIMGHKKALLLDTGAVRSAKVFPLQATVESLINEYLQKSGMKRQDYELVVAHTHAHGDHVAADGQFLGKAHTRVVGLSVQDVKKEFALSNWPDGSATYDLGGRVLDIVPIPGHEESSIAVYDRETAILLPGDSLYAGRHYVAYENWQTDRQSIMRLQKFMELKPVSHVLGTHIELWENLASSRIEEIPVGLETHSTHSHQEIPLQLEKQHLDEIADFFTKSINPPDFGKRHFGSKFIIHPY